MTKEEFEAVHAKSKAMSEIMVVFGITNYMANALCKKYGLEKRVGKRGSKKRVVLTRGQINKFYFKHGSNTREQAAQSLGCSEPTFSREIERLFPKRRDAKKNRPMQAVEMMRSEKHINEIAEKLEVSVGTVYRWWRERKGS